MILVISPAKALDYTSPLPELAPGLISQPDYLDQAAELITLLRNKSPAEIASLMKLSDALASLNVARYAAWSRPFDEHNARPAVLAFDGDVYDGLSARTLDGEALAWAQQHLRILSGLYGILRPLDLMQAYRLEMGTKLANPRGKDLYAFWGDTQTQALNELLAAELDAGRRPQLVNLASEEYFKSVKADKLAGELITPVFEDFKDGRYKIISFYAKRARGLMCRFAIERRLSDAEDLKSFDVEGYAFAADASDARNWVFRRKAQ